MFNVYRTSDYSHILMTGKAKGNCYDIFTQNKEKGIILDIVTSVGAFIGLAEIDPDSFFTTSIKRKAVIKSHDETRPHSIRFSPDGSMIAIGYKDSHKIDVFSTKDLTYLYSPDTTGIHGGNLNNVAWSANGSFLYATGTYRMHGKYVIRKWKDAGKGIYEDMPVSTSPISQILSLKDGRMVFTSAEPALSIINEHGNKIFYQRSAIADYRSEHGELLTSQDGNTIQFDYDDKRKTTSRFSINNRLQTGTSKESSPLLQKSIKAAAVVVIKDWQSTPKKAPGTQHRR